MKRRSWWCALWMATSLCWACGGDEGGSNNSSSAGQGASGQSGSSTGAGGGGPIEGDGIACGTTRCTMPEGSDAEPCCYDAFSSTCGMVGGFGDDACVALVESDPRCPSVELGPVTLTSCCTEGNMCGIMSMFSSGCTELSVAAQMARDRAAMFDEGDGGTSFPGDGGGFSLDFPDPQPCE